MENKSLCDSCNKCGDCDLKSNFFDFNNMVLKCSSYVNNHEALKIKALQQKAVVIDGIKNILEKLYGLKNVKSEKVHELDMRDLWKWQKDFQMKLNKFSDDELPQDMPNMFRDMICLMAEEFGELARADKRWRNFLGSDSEDGKTTKTIIENKREEIADIFIVAINLAMFSGFTYDDILAEMHKKIIRNTNKFVNSENSENDEINLCSDCIYDGMCGETPRRHCDSYDCRVCTRRESDYDYNN